ncbi:unnamed protein product [Cyprideis torosa]|uniref:Uncharacterized protein n=1 Tax=Cyprideis torosa TaxID=163714 RepID=A0A7R8WCW6_9CRUS|nr:unnamed protein product [Cyprideis torosa]CAG0893980.1 unnamed protein product [Cyprideis torosa]
MATVSTVNLNNRQKNSDASFLAELGEMWSPSQPLGGSQGHSSSQPFCSTFIEDSDKEDADDTDPQIQDEADTLEMTQVFEPDEEISPIFSQELQETTESSLEIQRKRRSVATATAFLHAHAPSTPSMAASQGGGPTEALLARSSTLWVEVRLGQRRFHSRFTRKKHDKDLLTSS